jgi:uncharacterized protein
MAIFKRAELFAHLRNQLTIDWFGHHGIAHWARVRANGLMLATETGANPHVVELFAFFHDSRRVNEHVDDGHGARGAALARRLKGRFFDATDEEMDLLQYACDHHSDGMTQGDATVLTCWDADRLDLGRVGITPRSKYLCTDMAKREGTMQRANRRAQH